MKCGCRVENVEVGKLCKYCGKTDLDTTKHVRYGNDLDNPVKHEFELPVKTVIVYCPVHAAGPRLESAVRELLRSPYTRSGIMKLARLRSILARLDRAKRKGGVK